MFCRFLFLFFFLAPGFTASSAWAQRVDQLPTASIAERPVPAQTRNAAYEEKIAAVVNDSVISSSDVQARMKLAILSSGLPETGEVMGHIFPQVLRSLIDEQLQMQEGKRLEITVSQDEIRNALKRLADDNRIPGGDMIAFLAARGVPSSTLMNQVRAALTWNKVVQRELRPRIDIGDDEIDAVIERIQANAGKQEFLVSEIYLGADNPKDEERISQFANSLVQQIRGGASFGSIARQFSEGSSAGSGGDIGWIQTGQLAPEVDKLLQTLQAGEIAGPVRSSSGFHILGVREKRTIGSAQTEDASVSLQQAFFPFVEGKPKEDLLKEANAIRQTIEGCNDLEKKLAESFPAWRWQDLGDIRLDKMPPWLSEKVRNIGVGHSSEAFATDKGALLVFVCGRNMNARVDRNEIMNGIGMERIELLARRHLRDLRRNAYIDVRISPSS